MPVYLIHFDEPYKHALHYIGFVESNLEARMKRHKDGDGARLLRVLKDAGIGWELVRVWPDGDREFERKLKNNSHSKRHCPVCKAKEHEQTKNKNS